MISVLGSADLQNTEPGKRTAGPVIKPSFATARADPSLLSFHYESGIVADFLYPFGQGRGLPLIGSMPNRLFCPEDLGGSGELTLVLVDQHAQVLDPELSEG